MPRTLLTLLCATQTLLAQDMPEASKSAEAPPSPQEDSVPSDHKLRVQDRLVYEIKEDPVSPASGQDVSRHIITPLGEVRFPISRGYGETVLVKVLNRTIAEVKSELAQKLEADYYEKATIYLKVESTLSAEADRKAGIVRFYGESKGALPIPPGGKLMLCDSLLQVGYSEWSDLDNVKIYRLDPVTGERKTLTFNADAVLNPNRRKAIPPDFELQDEDRVHVEEASFKIFK